MPITPGEIAFDENGIPLNAEYGNIYRSSDGGLDQARAVFLNGCGLPHAWQDKERFVVLETGFGLGLNFLATWEAFRAHPGRCQTLHFISIEKHPLTTETLARCHTLWPELKTLAETLRAQWPVLVAGYHRVSFDSGRVQLTLIFDDAEAALKQLNARADAIYLDGFSPTKNPAIRSSSPLKILNKLAAPGARLASGCVADTVRQCLQEADFSVEHKSEFGQKNARLEARHTEIRSAHPLRPAPYASRKEATLIGAGIAGASLAHELCARGWRVHLIERHPGPAMGASGNPAGVVRPQLTLDESFNGRLSRQAFLHTLKLISSYPLPLTPHASHDFTGVLHLASNDAQASHMLSMLATHRHPAEFSRWVSQDEASVLAGVKLTAPGLYFPQGGWLSGTRICDALLAACGDKLVRTFTHHATQIEQTSDGWRVWENDALLAESVVVVLTNATESGRFANLPLTAVRGQITGLPDGSLPGLKIPVTREGYVLPTQHGIGNVGASFAFDDDPDPRQNEQEENLHRLSQILQHAPAFNGALLPSRVSFRAATPDRMPLVGSIADEVLAMQAETTLERLPRLPGLYTMSGFGARGLVWGPFLAQALAARLDDEPWLLPRDLWQSIDPARFLLRDVRRKKS